MRNQPKGLGPVGALPRRMAGCVSLLSGRCEDRWTVPLQAEGMLFLKTAG